MKTMTLRNFTNKLITTIANLNDENTQEQTHEKSIDPNKFKTFVDEISRSKQNRIGENRFFDIIAITNNHIKIENKELTKYHTDDHRSRKTLRSKDYYNNWQEYRNNKNNKKTVEVQMGAYLEAIYKSFYIYQNYSDLENIFNICTVFFINIVRENNQYLQRENISLIDEDITNFFNQDELEKNIKLVKQKIENGNKIIIYKGKPESGKSSVLKHYVKQYKNAYLWDVKNIKDRFESSLNRSSYYYNIYDNANEIIESIQIEDIISISKRLDKVVIFCISNTVELIDIDNITIINHPSISKEKLIARFGKEKYNIINLNPIFSLMLDSVYNIIDLYNIVVSQKIDSLEEMINQKIDGIINTILKEDKIKKSYTYHDVYEFMRKIAYTQLLKDSFESSFENSALLEQLFNIGEMEKIKSKNSFIYRYKNFLILYFLAGSYTAKTLNHMAMFPNNTKVITSYIGNIIWGKFQDDMGGKNHLTYRYQHFVLFAQKAINQLDDRMFEWILYEILLKYAENFEVKNRAQQEVCVLILNSILSSKRISASARDLIFTAAYRTNMYPFQIILFKEYIKNNSFYEERIIRDIESALELKQQPFYMHAYCQLMADKTDLNINDNFFRYICSLCGRSWRIHNGLSDNANRIIDIINSIIENKGDDILTELKGPNASLSTIFGVNMLMYTAANINYSMTCGLKILLQMSILSDYHTRKKNNIYNGKESYSQKNMFLLCGPFRFIATCYNKNGYNYEKIVELPKLFQDDYLYWLRRESEISKDGRYPAMLLRLLSYTDAFNDFDSIKTYRKCYIERASIDSFLEYDNMTSFIEEIDK